MSQIGSDGLFGGFSPSDFIRVDGTSITTASIPFVQGLSVPDNESFLLGGSGLGPLSGQYGQAEILLAETGLARYLSITSPSVSTGPGLPFIFSSGATSDTGYSGGNLFFTAGTGGPSGEGGQVGFVAGTGGSGGAGGIGLLQGGEGGSGAAGGLAWVKGGSGSAGGAGGDATIDGGSGASGGTGGKVNLKGGSSSGTRGYVRVGSSGTPGNFSLSSANAQSSLYINQALEVDGVGYFDAGLVVPDNIEIQIGGAGPGTLSGYYGAGVLKLLDSGPFSKVRAITLGTVTSNTIGPGLDFIFTAGSTSASGEAGGDINFTSGASTTAGSGGGMNFSAGLAVGAGQTGGNISFTPGAGSGGATAGVIRAYDYSTPGPLTLFDSATGGSYAKTLNVTSTTTLASSLTGLLRADSGVVSVDSTAFITLASLSGTSPITYNSGTGAIGFDFSTNNTWTGTNAFTGSSATKVSSINASGMVQSVSVNAGGSGYTNGDSLTISGGGGTGATVTATVVSGAVVAVRLTANGSGYGTGTALATTGGTGTGCTVNINTLLANTFVVDTSVLDGGIGVGVAPASTDMISMLGGNKQFGINMTRNYYAVPAAPRAIQVTDNFLGNYAFPSPGAISLAFFLNDTRTITTTGGGDIISPVYVNLVRGASPVFSSNKTTPGIGMLTLALSEGSSGSSTYTSNSTITYTTHFVANGISAAASVFNYTHAGTGTMSHVSRGVSSNINYAPSVTGGGTLNINHYNFEAKSTGTTTGNTYGVGYYTDIRGFDTTFAFMNEGINPTFMGQDNSKSFWGTSSGTVAARTLTTGDASIYYDGTNFIINPKEIGTGYLSVLGNQLITGTGNGSYPYNLNISSAGSQSWMGIFLNSDTAGGAFFGMTEVDATVAEFQLYNYETFSIPSTRTEFPIGFFAGPSAARSMTIDGTAEGHLFVGVSTVAAGILTPNGWNSGISRMIQVEAPDSGGTAGDRDVGLVLKGKGAGTRGAAYWLDGSATTLFLDQIRDNSAALMIARLRTAGTPIEAWRAANGEMVINDGSIDYDFRVESNGDANNIFSDGGTDRVGIGNNAPGYKLDITGDANVSGVYRVGGTAGLSATYTFGGGGTGDIATMTFTGGILTAVTTVP